MSGTVLSSFTCYPSHCKSEHPQTHFTNKETEAQGGWYTAELDSRAGQALNLVFFPKYATWPLFMGLCMEGDTDVGTASSTGVGVGVRHSSALKEVIV